MHRVHTTSRMAEKRWLCHVAFGLNHFHFLWVDMNPGSPFVRVPGTVGCDSGIDKVRCHTSKGRGEAGLQDKVGENPTLL